MYSDDFFKAYADYLKEPIVRKNHDRIFRDWFEETCPCQLKVVDIGCGLGEFHQHGFKLQYVGLDLNPRVNADTLKVDYTKREWVKDLPFLPNAFVSLFSLEPMLDVSERYSYYDWLFDAIPTLQFGLSAGFYYASKADHFMVGEAGDITSYQTIEKLGEHGKGSYHEEWTVMHTPSVMFGQDVVEIWKKFTRKV